LDKKKDLLILDELHKRKNWKLFLKGLTDSSQHGMQTLVTGSAKLDIARKVGDSLAGRYFLYHCHPIDVKEAVNCFQLSAQDAFDRILNVSGFPEPFLLNDPAEYRRWYRTHSDIILKQDLIQLESVEDLVKIETLVELLRTRVGSTVAYANLAKDLDAAPKSVKKWLTILENLYIVFRLNPFFERLPRSIKKAPKYYFYDCAAVRGDNGAKFENLVALALKKEIDFRRDALGEPVELHFVRNVDGDEIDFLILNDRKIHLAIECKWSDTEAHKGFKTIGKALGLKNGLQLVAQCEQEKMYPFGVEVREAARWLRGMEI
jgi:predicted AAA+ superfamily ATPase